MTELNKSNGQEPPIDSNDPFEKYFDESKNFVTVSDISERLDGVREAQRLTKGEIRTGWTREMVLKDLGFKEGIIPELRCFAEVAKGEVPKAVVSFVYQDEIFTTLFNPTYLSTDLISKKMYASVYVKKGVNIVRKEILIKSGPVKPSNIDNLVISQALANELDVENGEEIFVESMYQKVSDVDLDEI